MKVKTVLAFVVMGVGMVLGAIQFLLFIGFCLLLVGTAIIMSLAVLQAFFR